MTLLENGTPAWPTITDGNKNTGTVINVTGIWDPIKDAIDGLIHSTTNPTVAPNAAIDELILARGSKATLKARLDVITNADGTLKSGVVTVQTEVETARGSQASLDARLDNGLNEDGTPVVATDSVIGAVSISAQTFAGPKTFDDPLTFAPGTVALAAQNAIASGGVAGLTDTTQHKNVTTGDTTLASVTLKGGTLSADKKIVRFRSSGTFAANANTKSIRFVFGGTTITWTNGATNGGSWYVEIDVIRTGAATQKITGFAVIRTGGGTLDGNAISSSAAETLANDITVATKGQSSAASDDVVQETFTAEVIG